MNLKNLLTTLLLLFVVASLVVFAIELVREQSAAGSDQETGSVVKNSSSRSRLIVYYFHTNTRCPTCRAIEAQALETLQTRFADQLARGEIAWQVLNFEAPENAHFARQFDLFTSMVVLAEGKDSPPAHWKSLDDVWVHVNNRTDYMDYVEKELKGFLEGVPEEKKRLPETFWLAVLFAFSWGILTSISPCPLATNVAAISYIGRRLDNARTVFASGFLYTLGRMAAYVGLATLLVLGVLSTGISLPLQKYMYKLVGPLLILLCLVLLDLVSLGRFNVGLGTGVQNRVARWGLWGAALLGILFALTFCPVSAMYYFGFLIPLSVEFDSSLFLPSVYGLATGLPVLLFAVLIAFGAQSVGRMYNRLAQIEWWGRRVTGVIMILLGFYFTLIYIYGVPVSEWLGGQIHRWISWRSA